METKQTDRKRGLIGLILLVAVLVFCVEGIFMMLEKTLPTPKAQEEAIPVYEVMDTETGAISRYTLSIVGLEEIPMEYSADWYARCTETQAQSHWLMYTDSSHWEVVLYLPELTSQISAKQVSVAVEEQEKGSALVVSLSTLGLEEGREPQDQLLYFQAQEGAVWPGQIRVVCNGEELSTGVKGIDNSGSIFWAEEGT